ncbi:hypothetical protein EPUS_03699 [Endocarpon pusillum Z07020]|uniref:Uncharacterized protein n=1 Tax=Endocarpon pusillum (strain Z07020 / HMAS-L-300199) TaxID=1263415 RepID=U1FXT5_ENDPU|nr:uncharacterized protein EPUS_03699 [Endocarpon pusillum Z07020]ERF69707.1 hypothetical protein EPUS_03699 [Endocarpon pusillum Z07020]
MATTAVIAPSLLASMLQVADFKYFPPFREQDGGRAEGVEPLLDENVSCRK